MTEDAHSDPASEADAAATAGNAETNRRKAIGRILALATAAPMAVLLFVPGAAAVS